MTATLILSETVTFQFQTYNHTCQKSFEKCLLIVGNYVLHIRITRRNINHIKVECAQYITRSQCLMKTIHQSGFK